MLAPRASEYPRIYADLWENRVHIVPTAKDYANAAAHPHMPSQFSLPVLNFAATVFAAMDWTTKIGKHLLIENLWGDPK